MIEGSKVVAFAHQEPRARYDVYAVETRAEAAGDGFRLSGEKTQVLDAVGADAVIVPARTSGSSGDREGLVLFLIPVGTPGLSISAQTRVDHRNTAIVRLDGVEVTAEDMLGAPGQGAGLLDAVIDRATVVLCGEMLGGMSEAFDLTLDYLKTRDQFGVKIGSFQALQHRAAKVFMEIELRAVLRDGGRPRGRCGRSGRVEAGESREGALLRRLRSGCERGRPDVRWRRDDGRVRHRLLSEAGARL